MLKAFQKYIFDFQSDQTSTNSGNFRVLLEMFHIRLGIDRSLDFKNFKFKDFEPFWPGELP